MTTSGPSGNAGDERASSGPFGNAGDESAPSGPSGNAGDERAPSGPFGNAGDESAPSGPCGNAGDERVGVKPTEAQRRVAALLESAGSAVVLTGAGISVPSGIPDFRTPVTGMWANVDPMQIAQIGVWRSDPERFWAFYAQRFHLLGPAQPNPAHLAVAELQRRGLIGPLITQNIDRLHAKGGADDIIEMHGSISHGRCLACGARVEYDELTARIDDAPDGVPRCVCGAPLKPGVVLFGEMLDADAVDRAVAACASADLIIAIGSSLEVHPVAALPSLVLERGGDLVLVTQGATPYDDVASERLVGDVVDELTGVLAALG